VTWLVVTHRLPERTRLRSPALRKTPAACTRLADALAAVPGVREVRVRPYTGSALILHDPEVTLDALTQVACGALDGARVLAPGEAPPLSTAVPAFSSIRQKLIALAREIDRDIRRGSDGSVDLGTLATLGLASAGALGVAATGQLPMPPWFNLAWWAYRTFMTTHHRHDAPKPEAAGAAQAPPPA
jgi:heavy-metal-associated domain-containing protein